MNLEQLDEVEEDLPTNDFHKIVDRIAETQEISHRKAVLFLMMNCTEWLDDNTEVTQLWKTTNRVEDVTLQADFRELKENTKRLILHFQERREQS